MTSEIVRRARHLVGAAIKSGRLIRPASCERCGAPDRPMKDGRTSIQAHHHKGYDLPLDVEWLCVPCHHADTPVPYGTKAAAAKVNWQKVSEIRDRYSAGESYYRIADEEGLDRTTVHRIVTHRSWPEHARPKEISE